MAGRVLVIGGGGFYGRYLINDLLQHTEAHITVASRKPPSDMADGKRVHTAVCDLNDLATVQKLAAGCDIVAHCAGPFHYLPLNPLKAAIQAGTHYVDISEDRAFAREAQKLAPEIQAAGMTVCSGFSVAPAMEALFAEMLRPCFDRLTAVRTFAAPDTRKHRGAAMFHTMLFGVGRPFRQPRGGDLAQVAGWTEPEWVEFPPPIGKRLTYLVLEMADLDYLPTLFGVETVEFKAGTEHVVLNRMLGLAATIRQKTGYPAWENFTVFVQALSWLAGRVGKDEGGVFFEVSGLVDKTLQTHRVALMAKQDGGLIPSVLAGIAIEMLLNGRLPHTGIVPIHTWISPGDLVNQLERRGLSLYWKHHDTMQWQPFDKTRLLLT